MKPDHLFSAGWRVFFLAAGLWGVLSVALWLMWWWTGSDGGLGVAPQLWHAHEMIFGYAVAAIGGFFLTAVPNWTGAKEAPERFILLVSGLWLAGRLAVGLSGALPAALVAVVDLAFLPVLAAKILTQLMVRPKPQNMMFLLLISMLWLSNLMVHLEWMGLAGTEMQGLRAGLLTVCAMIAAMGGRVTPAFTRNAMLREGQEARLPVSHQKLDLAGTALAILTALTMLIGLPDAVTGTLALLAGLAALARLSGWRALALPGQPIVWALHLGYGMLALGFIAWGLAQLGLGSEIGALHLLGIGGIGGMTVAVMSRAALGHSGRALVAPRPVALAYALMPLAAILRWAGSEWAGLYGLGVVGAALLWCLALALYTVALWPVFFAARPRGKVAA
ncbi:NnrS family protein [Paracoccus sp. (in: a-proteobacteria)]|uniref:NnrS family protein n=1 Tax=Paracoccus sp. TaxID=267 RepID=UPI00321F9F67